MTQDKVIAMAQKAGMKANMGRTDRDGTHRPAINALGNSVPVEWLERMVQQAVAKEREDCAALCDELGWTKDGPECAAAIRARGDTC